MTLNFTENLLFREKLKCVTCNGLLEPPVVLIEHKGNVCGKCFSSTIHNPPFIQNETLDYILNNLIVSCENVFYGCKEKISYVKLKTHQDNCHYAPVKCFEKNCIWKGKKDELPNHFKEDHKNGILEDVDGKFEFSLNLKTATDFIRMLLVKKETVFFLTLQILTENIIYNLYKVDNTLSSTVSLEHLGLGENARRTKTEIDIQSLDYLSADTKYTKINISSLKTVLNLNSEVVVRVILDFLNSDDDISRQIQKCLECINCFHPMRAPIYQCNLGHCICNNCLPKLSKCPACAGTFSGKIRNFALEALTAKCYYKCMYETEGCKAVCKGSEIEAHEMQCPDETYSCPMLKCKNKFSFEMLKNHLKTVHAFFNCLETDSFRFVSYGYSQPVQRYIFINNTFIHICYIKEKVINNFFSLDNPVKSNEAFTYKFVIKNLYTRNPINSIICKLSLDGTTNCQTKIVNSKETKTLLLQTHNHPCDDSPILSLQIEEQLL